MPPKAKITREMIVDAAFEIARPTVRRRSTPEPCPKGWAAPPSRCCTTLPA